MTASSIVKRFQEIKHHVHKLASKHQHVRIVAVSKTYPSNSILELHKSKAKQCHFGENYVKELSDKALELKKYTDIKWHFIGHLQSNKAAGLVNAVPNLWCVETVDRPKIAHALNKAVEQCIALKKRKDPLNVLVQVNTSDEPQKSGCMIQDVVPLVNTIRYDCPALNFMGLMTIGSASNSSLKHANPDFEKLIACRNTVCDAVGLREKDVELSMGMSADYEEAIKQGSTNIRVGSAIFGSRKNVVKAQSSSASATVSEGAPEARVDKSEARKEQKSVVEQQDSGDKTTVTLAERKVGSHSSEEIQVTKESLPETKETVQEETFESPEGVVQKKTIVREEVPSQKEEPKKKGFQPADIKLDEQPSPSRVPENFVAMDDTPKGAHPDFNRPAEAPPLKDELKPKYTKEMKKKDDEEMAKQRSEETVVEENISVKTRKTQDGDEAEVKIKKRSTSTERPASDENKVTEKKEAEVEITKRNVTKKLELDTKRTVIKADESEAEVIRISPTIKRIVKRIDLDGKETIISTEEVKSGEDTQIAESKEQTVEQ
uniref:Pyridoxal phosphate homeostasis protein n=1 Tax=Percolomonas cosmopolitus TaxID=63605 RepID=A0A7S1PG85_9EUKA|eukprot:CAMPEP_0117441928 /NCGR_PEP_ID=MMETSP0759-20121206/3886_1 /TAXON_ID=63605 /ORGANISM="Percolomonas cosmopolitus, Strain WS" /LENGTH=546 /DNA_ID=CAMNT_0005233795 /DNA_START=66 /DNA_END=1706 /DNA_ORIENTATION=-